MTNLELCLEDKLLRGISELAVRHYGEDSESSRERVVEAALKMRLVWSKSVEKGQQETDERVSSWEFSQPPTIKEDTATVSDWLFRR